MTNADTRPERHGRSGRKPGETKTSPRKVRGMLKAAEAVRLRAEGQGLTYDEIAQRVGYGHRQSAYRAVRQELARVTAETRENARELLEAELSELDDLASAVWDAAMLGDLPAVEQARRVLADRRKLLGTDAPLKVEASTEMVSVDVDELRALLNALGWELVRLPGQGGGDADGE